MKCFLQHQSSTKSHLHYSSIKILFIRNRLEHRVCNASVEVLIKHLTNKNLLQTQVLQYSCIMFNYMVNGVLRLKVAVPFWCYIPWRNGTLDSLGQKSFFWVRHTSNDSIFSYLSLTLIFPFLWKNCFHFSIKGFLQCPVFKEKLSKKVIFSKLNSLKNKSCQFPFSYSCPIERCKKNKAKVDGNKENETIFFEITYLGRI